MCTTPFPFFGVKGWEEPGTRLPCVSPSARLHCVPPFFFGKRVWEEPGTRLPFGMLNKLTNYSCYSAFEVSTCLVTTIIAIKTICALCNNSGFMG